MLAPTMAGSSTCGAPLGSWLWPWSESAVTGSVGLTATGCNGQSGGAFFIGRRSVKFPVFSERTAEEGSIRSLASGYQPPVTSNRSHWSTASGESIRLRFFRRGSRVPSIGCNFEIDTLLAFCESPKRHCRGVGGTDPTVILAEHFVKRMGWF